MIALRLALAGALGLAACTSPEEPERAERPTLAEAQPPNPARPAAPDTFALDIDARSVSQRPTAPVRIDGACPFEGCQYGTWTTSGETVVYETAGDTTSAAFSVPAGTELDAPTGFVLVTRVGRSVAERPAEVFVSFEDRIPVAAGDTVLVLDYEGEGSYRVWHDGRIGFASEVAPLDGLNPANTPFRSIVEPEQQWWARVTAPDGRAGWLWMDRTPSVTGADALAAP